MKHIFTWLLLVVLATSCDQSTSSKITTVDTKTTRYSTSPAQAVSIQTSTLANDPTFVDAKDTVSLHGPTSITRNVLQDRNGNIWFASWEGIIRYDGNSFTNFTLKNNLPRFHVFSVLEDRSGKLWFGTVGGGLFRYDGTTFTHFTTEHGLINNNVACLLEDKAGHIWIGTANGLSRYDGQRFSNFDTQDGLIHNSVFAMVMDNAGTIWLGTQGGVACFDPIAEAKSDANKFIKKGDLPGNVRAMLKDKAGNIWIGNGYGLWCYNGKILTTISKQATTYLYEDRAGNLWLSQGKISVESKDMSLAKYDGKTVTIIKNEYQIFGILEDKNGNIWYGTVNGVAGYSPALEKQGNNAFTRIGEQAVK